MEIVVSSNGEISKNEISENKQLLIAKNLEIQERKLALRERETILKLENRERKLALREQELALKSSSRQSRSEKNHRKITVKTKLVQVNLLVHDMDFENVSLMVWGFAVMRDPKIKREDVAGKKFDGPIFMFPCFPEDREELLLTSKHIYSQRMADSIEQQRAEIERALSAEAEGEWPEDNPK